MKLIILVFILSIAGKIHAQTPEIGAVKMDELVAMKNASGKTLVINFWSTWCKPCLEEIPHFLSAVDQYGDNEVELWLVSLDTKKLFETKKLLEFVRKRGWKAKFFWLNETNADVYCPLIDERWSGVLPATLITNAKSDFKYFQEEAMTADELSLKIDAAQKK